MVGEVKEHNILAQEHEDEAEEPLPGQPERFDWGGMQNERYFAAHNNQMEGGIKGESFSSSSSFFQCPVLLTLVLLLIDHHKEKEERRGRDVLDTALTALSAELRRWPAAECGRRYPTLRCGWDPEVLGAWSRLLDGRCVGHVSGSCRAVWPSGRRSGKRGS